ncbi:MAG TPA: Na+/H+ antiporter subunit D [Anaerolineaceae bacterium]|nr:Na+/H+ antiporter subunit D [Anaerolineaceae bacterium]
MIVLPILVPLFFAIISVFFWENQLVKRFISIISTAILTIVSLIIFLDVYNYGIHVIQVGNWPAPFGISLVVDLFSAIMLLTISSVAFIISLYSIKGIDLERRKYGFFPLFQFLLMGINGSLITGDLFNLYVWFEVMLMSSFVLIALGGERDQIEGAVKYVILNLLASIIFLSAIGLTYNLAGTLNMADLALRFQALQSSGQVTVIAILFLVSFGIKSAIFPLFFWLPASYHTPPVTVTALFSASLTKVGMYALIRFFTLLFRLDNEFILTIILVSAGFTMLTGVLGAASQTDLRRLLSFHIISQIGYILMGLGLFTEYAIAASIYFMVHIILAKTALFLSAGMIEWIQGSFDLKKLGGLYKNRVAFSMLFLLPALSVAGLPPFSGFFAKLGLIIAGLESRQYFIIAVALVVSLMTLFSMTKVWNEAFWKPPKDPNYSDNPRPVSAWRWVPSLMIVVLSILLGLLANPLFEISQMAAAQLMNPSEYIRVVLGVIR